MNLANCPRCGKLFAKGIRDVCNACTREIDKEYELCAEYLRKYKGAIITEVSDETGVSIRQITKFIREGRISLLNAPNLSYPCESCGTLIRDNQLCDRCRTRLSKDAQELNQRLIEQRRRESEDAGHNVYQGIQKYKDK